MIIALTSIWFVCTVLVLYPYLIYPVLLRLLPEREIRPEAGHQRSVSLLFCAYNEGGVVAEKLANIEALKARHPDLEVLAYDDGSSDDTRHVLEQHPELVTLVTGQGRTGKAHGMKALAARASGEVLVFTDANVMLREDAIEKLMSWYGDPEVGGVCGTLRYLNPKQSATASVGGAYWRLEEKLKTLESRSGNVMGADGSIFSVRRELYPDFPDTVLDDLTVSMAVVFAGKRLIKVDDVVAFEQLVSSRGDEFSRKVRISARAFHTHLYLRSQLGQMTPGDKFKYRSRKLVRWLGGLFLGAGVAAGITLCLVISPWLGLAAAAGLTVGSAIGVRVRRGPIAVLTEAVLALFATLLGVVQAARGRTFVTWSPAKSR